MTIEEYFGTLQQSFVEIWKNHLQTSKYSDHKALNDYYDDITDCVDGLIEAWQGINGKTGELKNTISTKFDDPVPYLKELKKFTKEGRDELISKDDTELWSCIDDILKLIDSTLYQLEELKENNGIKSLKDYIYECLNEAKMPEEYAWHGNSAYIISGSEEEGTVAILIGGWNAREIQEAIKLYNADKPSKYDEYIEEVEWDEFMKEQ